MRLTENRAWPTKSRSSRHSTGKEMEETPLPQNAILLLMKCQSRLVSIIFSMGAYDCIAGAYLKIGYTRMARIYTEVVLDPLRGYFRRLDKSLFEYERGKPQERVFIAKLLCVAAQISYQHGNVRRAVMELGRVEKWELLKGDDAVRYAQYDQRYNELCARDEKREKARQIQSEKCDAKIEGT